MTLERVEVGGRSVDVSLRDSENQIHPSSASEVMTLVVTAVVDSIYLAVGQVVKAVTLNLARTALDISVEMSVLNQESRVTKQIALRGTTAVQYNSALVQLANENGWDSDVKDIFRQGLLTDLRREMRRLDVR